MLFYFSNCRIYKIVINLMLNIYHFFFFLFCSVFREKLFTSHLFVEELVPSLLNVFVSIEITGQSVQFDQKFQYRRPMFIVLDYLWKFDVHKRKMKVSKIFKHLLI